MRKLFLLPIVLAFFVACQNRVNEKPFIAIEGIDSTIKPGDDFYNYVNLKWYDTAQIPPSQSGVGAYRFMNYQQRLKLQGILDSVSKSSNPAGSLEQKIGDFYASGMDTNTINQRGFEPLKAGLSKINAIGSVSEMLVFIAEQTKLSNSSLIEFQVSADQDNSSMNIGHLYQTGIGMPDRDYYFKTDTATLAIQQAYKKCITELFTLTGTEAALAEKNALLVYNIQKQLATAHKTNIELRDIKNNFHKIALTDLNKQQPNIGWASYFQHLGASFDSLDVAQPGYYEKLNTLLKTVPLEDWKLYLSINYISSYADYLSKPFVDVAFAYNKALTGQAVQKTRGESMSGVVDTYLGMALGQLYTKLYFPESAKTRMLELVNNLQKAFSNRVDHLDWMSDSTKQKAKEKLFAITKKIGYPDKWRDYKNVSIVKGKYFENVVSAAANNFQYNLGKLGKPVDKTEWFTTPSTVTAYNNPYANEIVFPAGILQPPYFDNNADDALNYGGIGMVIGHEMTHTFDDQGAQFDKNGNVKSWWTAEDYAKFKAKTQQVVDLYSQFTVLDSMHVKGALTVGENTADLSGIAVAYDAFKMTKQGQDTTKIGGFTPDQRFFFSIARIWRVKMKDEYMRYWVNNDPHSPPMWRVNGPLMNIAAFYTAFHVQPGDKMYLEEGKRIKIW
ncbi:M13 family metallopeptidase [Chitinophaga sancti]|uniref:M13 family metallopeptidase n=1 Tax=Chitinophaga sancti TaxID=1004 RepID=A0A1K1S1D2_9BACT|nr:M13 family metallopeptidase [Chitinophaga sancti]WQD59711.1 M13 family metallopeptidase [Chitinophaga sancti]WQG88158.1 M13 family metallopeptidase [Chitinophaga sancti]SFW78153.1 putative endopeptidase [Chitinophaga sancti]